MTFSLQRGRKCLNEHGHGSNNVRRIEGNIQMCCNVTAEGLCDHSVHWVNRENF
jgi:hypothetical protein